MNRETIAPVLEKVGILPPAVEDALARAERCFGNGSPSEAELHAWAAQLCTEAPHLFGTKGTAAQPATHELIPDWVSPSEKLARARAAGLVPVHDKQSRRPQPFTPTPAQHAELAKLEPVARLTRYREWQAEAQTAQR